MITAVAAAAKGGTSPSDGFESALTLRWLCGVTTLTLRRCRVGRLGVTARESGETAPTKEEEEASCNPKAGDTAAGMEVQERPREEEVAAGRRWAAE